MHREVNGLTLETLAPTFHIVFSEKSKGSGSQSVAKVGTESTLPDFHFHSCPL